MVPRMIEGLKRWGKFEADTAETEEVAVWRMVQERAKGRPLGRKANLNRFLGFVDRAEECQPFWGLDLYERT
eukprot:14172174-Alexandrium_andersonii.AAC.1